jgi:hypothetical protein
MKQPFCAPVDRLGFQPLIVPGKPICLVQKPLCFATSAMLNVTEVKQRSAGRDRKQKRSRKRQHVRDGAGRASWGSFLIGVWFVFRANLQVTGHAAIDFIPLL